MNNETDINAMIWSFDVARYGDTSTRRNTTRNRATGRRIDIARMGNLQGAITPVCSCCCATDCWATVAGEMIGIKFKISGKSQAWITDALRVQLPQNFSRVKAFVWFNYPILEHNVYQQWPIESQPDAQAAFKDGIRSIYYRPQITSFPTQKGVKVPLPR